MGTLQTTYLDRMATALVGMIANTEPNNLISKQVSVAAIPFGAVVKQGASADLIAPATAAVDVVRGIAVRDQSANGTVDNFTIGEDALIMQRGVIWCLAGAACTVGGAAYMVVGTAQAGRMTSTSVSNLPIPGGTFESAAAAAGDLVKVRLS